MPEKMTRFEAKKSLAGVLQPGDGTRYEIVAVLMRDSVEVIILNNDFFDKITFLYRDTEPYYTFRDTETNPWTIKAAKEIRDMLLKEVS
jgi:hypothetical protein